MRKITTNAMEQGRSALSGAGLVVLAALCGCADTPAPPPPPPATLADEQAVLNLETQWCEAFRSGDSAALARIEDDAYSYTGLRAEPGTRADDLGQARNHSVEYSRFENHDQATRIDGDTIVVSGLSSQEGVAGDVPFKLELRFTDTFARRKGEWKATTRQVARLVP